VAPATLENTSHGGLSVQLKVPISVGSHVTVRWGSEQVSGTVTNCRREKANYVAGIMRAPDEDFDPDQM
jgi:hypothetical protein